MEADYGMFANKRDLYDKDLAALDALRYIWKNGGRLPNGEPVDLKDTFKVDNDHTRIMKDAFTNDYPHLTERVIQEVSNESSEPTAVLEPYLETIKLKRPGGQLTVPTWSAVHAADVPEGTAYPKVAADVAGVFNATIGKAGLQVAISEEMIRFSEYDLINKQLRAAGAALKRHKEKKIADAIVKYGTVVFDNNDSSKNNTEGRNAGGQLNGTVVLEDFFRTHEALTANGYHPNTLILHPNAWMIFAMESIARLFGLQRGVKWASDANPVRKGNNTSRVGLSVPTSFPSDWNIVVSPYVPYSPAGAANGGGEWALSHVIMCDANALGVIVDNGGGVQTVNWKDPDTDLQNVRLKEEYGVSILNDGKGIGLIKNVSVGRGIDFWENTVYSIPSQMYTGHPDTFKTNALFDAMTGAFATAVLTGVK